MDGHTAGNYLVKEYGRLYVRYFVVKGLINLGWLGVVFHVVDGEDARTEHLASRSHERGKDETGTVAKH